MFCIIRFNKKITSVAHCRKPKYTGIKDFLQVVPPTLNKHKIPNGSAPSFFLRLSFIHDLKSFSNFMYDNLFPTPSFDRN